MSLSLRRYAAHRAERGLPGRSHTAIRRAIESGRLERSVEIAADGAPRIIDAAAADEEWAEATRPAASSPKAPPTAEGDEDSMSFAEARRRKEIEQWRRERLRRLNDDIELRHREGQLVDREDVRRETIERYTAVKTKVLGLPVRIRQRIPGLSQQDVATISDLVYETLEDLGDGES